LELARYGKHYLESADTAVRKTHHYARGADPALPESSHRGTGVCIPASDFNEISIPPLIGSLLQLSFSDCGSGTIGKKMLPVRISPAGSVSGKFNRRRANSADMAALLE
jgi:hypothetical protein